MYYSVSHYVYRIGQADPATGRAFLPQAEQDAETDVARP